MLSLSSCSRVRSCLPLLLLAACATPSAPPEPLRPGPQARLQATGDARTLPEHEPAAAGPGAWWTAFGDPQLDRLIDDARLKDLGLLAARQRLLAARALRPAAEATYKPELSLRSGAVATPDSRSGWVELGFDARWELGLFGRDAASQALAQAEQELAEAEFEQARLSLVAELVRGWLEWRHELARHEQARVTVLAEERCLQQLQGRVDLGLLAASTLAPQRQRLAAVREAEQQIARLLPLQRSAC